MRFSIHYIDETDSTNRALWRMTDTGSISGEGLVLQAGNQTAGRGLGNNRWTSEPNQNLTVSILLKPVFLPPAQQFFLNKSVAISIRNTLSVLCPDQAFKIKWPNDIYADNKKIAGTLIENRIMGQTYELSIVGIGINVNQTYFPADLPNPSSLALLCKKKFIVSKCLNQLLQQTGRQYDQLIKGNHKELNEEYLRHLMGYRKWMRFKNEKNCFEGRITGVDEYGKMILERRNGKPETFGMKEIQMLLD
ncbi:MAG: biotin--[acetyl-CoA-carboxylase] ligase [Bacteroidales bacterium]